jgi:serine/threonine protein phosphatase PrpC
LAYNLVSKKSKTSLDSKKIGTTVLVALITDNHVDVFNLGDTRLYHYNLDANK